MLGIKQFAVGAVAVMASLLPVAEIGLFGYETFASEQASADQRTYAFQDLLAFQAQIELHASQTALMPDGPQKENATARIGHAADMWQETFKKWRQGDYEAMAFSLKQGRGTLGADVAEEPTWIEDPSVPHLSWFLVGGGALVAVGAWWFVARRTPKAS